MWLLPWANLWSRVYSSYPLSPIPPMKRSISRFRRPIFIPHPAIKIFVIPHLASISFTLIPHPGKPMLDPLYVQLQKQTVNEQYSKAFPLVKRTFILSHYATSRKKISDGTKLCVTCAIVTESPKKDMHNYISELLFSFSFCQLYMKSNWQ